LATNKSNCGGKLDVKILEEVPYESGGHLFYKDEMRPLIEPIVMQFTGVTDKSGKEIYQDDIIKFEDRPTGVEDGIGAVYWYNAMWRVQWSMIPLGDYPNTCLEIIGNIHQNLDFSKHL